MQECCCSVAVWLFATLWTTSWTGFPVLHHLQEFVRTTPGNHFPKQTTPNQTLVVDSFPAGTARLAMRGKNRKHSSLTGDLALISSNSWMYRSNTRDCIKPSFWYFVPLAKRFCFVCFVVMMGRGNSSEKYGGEDKRPIYGHYPWCLTLLHSRLILNLIPGWNCVISPQWFLGGF